MLTRLTKRRAKASGQPSQSAAAGGTSLRRTVAQALAFPLPWHKQHLQEGTLGTGSGDATIKTTTLLVNQSLFGHTRLEKVVERPQLLHRA